MDTYLRQVREYNSVTLKEYQGDWKIQRIVERTPQMMEETCVGIENHLISDRGMRSPAGYSDAFLILKENALIDDSQYGSLDKMAESRNIVVHQYEGVDAGIVPTILNDHLMDFERFRNVVIEYLGSL